jgi:hypothetical protein
MLKGASARASGLSFSSDRFRRRLAEVTKSVPTACPCGGRRSCPRCEAVRERVYDILAANVPRRLTQRDIVELIKSKIPQTPGGQSRFAQAAGITEQQLSDILHERRAPSPRLLNAIGVKKVTAYELEGQ